MKRSDMERSDVEAEALGALLARTNATLNLSSGILLMVGWVFIRRGNVRRHRLSMLAAVTTSSLFLIFYVTRLFIIRTTVGWLAGSSRPGSTYPLPDLWSTSCSIMCTGLSRRAYGFV